MMDSVTWFKYCSTGRSFPVFQNRTNPTAVTSGTEREILNPFMLVYLRSDENLRFDFWKTNKTHIVESDTENS